MFSAAISHNCRVVTSNSHDLMQTIPTTPTMTPALLANMLASCSSKISEPSRRNARGNLTIRNVDDHVIQQLKEQAKANQRLIGPHGVVQSEC